MKFTIWIRYRIKLAWWVLRHDSTAFAEALSGLFLVGLRGALLVLKPTDVPYDVIELLYRIGVTENRWAVWLMICGILQIIFAGSPHSLIRLWLKVLIVLAFALITAAYGLTGEFNRPTVLSLICIMAFYSGLMIRVFMDRRRGVLSWEERHAATHSR